MKKTRFENLSKQALEYLQYVAQQVTALGAYMAVVAAGTGALGAVAISPTEADLKAYDASDGREDGKSTR